MLSLSLVLTATFLGGSSGPGPTPASAGLDAAVRRYVASYVASSSGVTYTHTAASAFHATPAWARKYNLNCSACHTPAVPRLNETGMRFKWAGYRMPEEIGEAVEVAKVQNYLAAGASVQYEYDKTEDTPTNVSALSLPGVTVFYAGPFGRNFSGFFELESGADETERIAQVSALWGKEKSYGGVRLGQMHYLAEWGVAGFDRPIGINAPLPLEESVSGTTPFAFGEHQLGVEAFYVRGSNRLSAQVLNGVNVEGMGAGPDADTRKDFLVTDQVLIDKAGSGIQGVAYYGTIRGLDASAPDINSHFWRLGLTANKIISDFELLGTVIYAKDIDLPIGGASAFTSTENKGVGWWASGQYTFHRTAEMPLTVFSRYEYLDPNTDTPDNATRRVVLGAVLPLNVPQYLRGAIEYHLDTPQGGGVKTNNLIAQIWLNF